MQQGETKVRIETKLHQLLEQIPVSSRIHNRQPFSLSHTKVSCRQFNDSSLLMKKILSSGNGNFPRLLLWGHIGGVSSG